MRGLFFVIPMLCLILSGCGISKLNDEMQRSTTLIHENSDAIASSTTNIQQNADAIAQSTKVIEDSTSAFAGLTAFIPGLAKITGFVIFILMLAPSLLLCYIIHILKKR